MKESNFWSKVDKTDSCWNWTGSKDRHGYGRFHDRSNKIIGAHRVSYELIRKKIPEGLQIDHLCRNRACVNPDHLEVVSSKENCRRGNTGKHNSIKTHCPQGHEYTQENTRLKEDTSGLHRRICRICTSVYMKKHYQTKVKSATDSLLIDSLEAQKK